MAGILEENRSLLDSQIITLYRIIESLYALSRLDDVLSDQGLVIYGEPSRTFSKDKNYEELRNGRKRYIRRKWSPSACNIIHL
jgi:hypothetical protein